MAGKKGGKEKKAGDAKDKLPPPPNLDQTRQGALEALLQFKIHGKEDILEVFEEEAEEFKSKNDQQKDCNHRLKLERSAHHETLVKEARKLDDELDARPVVEKTMVEKALREKLELAKQLTQLLAEIEAEICELDVCVATGRDEIKRWTHFRDIESKENASHISFFLEQMGEWEREEKHLQGELDRTQEATKLEVDRRSAHLEDKKKQEVYERVMKNIDSEIKSELSDNIWLHKQVFLVQNTVETLKKEAIDLEQRNLDLINMLSEAHRREIELMNDVYSASTGKSRQLGCQERGLPSLVDVAKCTSDQDSGCQASRIEMQLLSVHGYKPSHHSTPANMHLPPIEHSNSTHTAVPSTTNWPITNSMLTTVLQNSR